MTWDEKRKLRTWQAKQALNKKLGLKPHKKPRVRLTPTQLIERFLEREMRNK